MQVRERQPEQRSVVQESVGRKHPQESGRTMQQSNPQEIPSYLSVCMSRFRLELGQIAKASGVPLSIVWRISHNQAVTTRNANRVRLGVWKLSGIPYMDPIITMDEELGTGPLPVISHKDEQDAKVRRVRLLPR